MKLIQDLNWLNPNAFCLTWTFGYSISVMRSFYCSTINIMILILFIVLKLVCTGPPYIVHFRSLFLLIDHIQPAHLPLVHFSCGVVAGTLASVATQPADVIKTYMQMNPDKFSSITAVVKHVYKVSTSTFLTFSVYW